MFYDKTKTYFIKVNVPLCIAIIRIANKAHINDISNSIILGMQHNLRHFQGEVSFTKNIYKVLDNYLLIICNILSELTWFWTKSSK